MSAVQGEGRELCRDRSYPTKYLSNLPQVYQLSPTWTLSVNYARVQQLDDCRQLVQDAADRGDNVGTDEFSDPVGDVLIFGMSEIFVATDDSSGRIKAFIAIVPSMYARNLNDKVLASIYVIRSADMATDHVAYQSLVRLGVRLTSQIELGYTVCAVCATFSCPAIVKALRAEGFQISATLPDSVNLAGIGLRESVILTKDLGLPDRPPRPLQQVIDSYNRFAAAFLPPTLSPLPTYDFLPRDFVFSCGLRCVCRNVTEDDVPKLFAMVMEAAQNGDGYSVNEFPSMDYFRRLMMADCACVVYELQSTGDIVGFVMIGDSHLARTKLCNICESFTVVDTRYRGRGLGREMTRLELAMMVQTGRTAGINDPMMTNWKMLDISRKENIQIVGTIPKSAYRPPSRDELLGGQWVDTLVLYERFDPHTNATFTQLCDNNAREQQKVDVTSSKL